MKVKVSSYLIVKTLSPFCLSTDDECERLIKLDLNENSVLIDLFKKYVEPHFQQYDEQSQEAIKNSLSYFIKSNTLNLERIFDAFQMPFDPPENNAEFLKSLWEVLFINELVDARPVDEYVVDDSENFVNSLHKKGHR